MIQVPRANTGRRTARRLLKIGVLLLIATYAPAAQALAGKADIETLSGQVTRGATFIRPLKSGLRFQLLPTSHGWTVWVGKANRKTENYAAAATPPFRGMNPTRIEGWHFRNRDNTGPNATGPLNVNAPQRTRRFRFVLNASDYRKSFESIGVLLWPAGKDRKIQNDAQRTLEATPKAQAELIITELLPGNMKPGQRAWIERMAFTLRIRYPGN